ncbi:MAG: Re/Si-specific NAD(P)(+) transhydrogenase subunit alpha [Planctomycetaceae bacterium]
MIVGIAKETAPDERRVALVPAAVKTLQRMGFDLLVQSGAGVAAGFPDAAYDAAGAKLAPDLAKTLEPADIVVAVRADPAATRLPLRNGQWFIAQCDPLSAPQHAVSLAESGANVFALELVPRITRAQAMDVLSSMATIAGYKGVLIAAGLLPQVFPMLTTAAGTLKAARVLVLGAGVAGLQAIATARRLGAIVHAYDVRPAVKEQVESLGAKFVEIPLQGGEGTGGYAKAMDEEFYRRQREYLKEVLSQTDVAITTAAIPGKKSPILITTEMAQAMPPGSVIVDLAAERGGNCEATKSGETISCGGVTIAGPLNLPATVPNHASQMYSQNVLSFLKLLVRDGKLLLDMTDEVVAGTLLARGGQVVHKAVRDAGGMGPLPAPPPPEPEPPPTDSYQLSVG